MIEKTLKRITFIADGTPKLIESSMKGRHSRWSPFVVGLAIVLLPCCLFALDPSKRVYQYNCRNWTRQSGLPINAIRSITQTRDGYIWLGSPNGLVRFDGLDFIKVIPPNEANFRSQSITSITSSRDGGFWFGIDAGSFGYCNPDMTFSLPPRENWISPQMSVRALFESSDGSLWVGAGNGIGQAQKHRRGGFFTDRVIEGSAFFEDNQHRIWIGTVDRGLFYWKAGELKTFPDLTLSNHTVFAVTLDAAGRVWAGTENGLRCFDAGFRPTEILPITTEVRALLSDSHGAMWIGTSGDGLIHYYHGETIRFSKTNGLADDFVTSLLEDREGSVWVGTREGLSQLSDVKFPILSTPDGFSSVSCHGVCSSTNGWFWAALDRGVALYNGSTVANFASDAGLPVPYIKRVFEARDGDLYLLNGSRGIDVLSRGKVVAKFTCESWPTALAEDAQGVVASVGPNLFRVSRTGLVPFSFTGRKAPDFYWIRNISSGPDGTLLVASVNGVFRLKGSVVEHWGTDEGLGSLDVSWASQEKDGTIWAGLATGISRIRNHKVRNIVRENGLPANNIFAIIPDHRGDLWMYSNKGIIRANRKSLDAFADGKTNQIECAVYDGLDSLKTIDTTEVEYVGCSTPDGKIWFPTPQGVVMIDPDHITTNLIPPFVHIDQVSINGIDQLGPESARAKPGNGELQIQYSGLSYIAPNKVRFRYQLEGFDATWIDAGNRRSAFYTNLKPKHYVFRLQACNADGVWNVSGAGIEIDLPPYFYQTGWFNTVCGLGAVALLFGIYVWRVRHLETRQDRLQKANQKLESMVQDRTREVAEQRNLLRTLIDHLPDYVFAKDAQGRVIVDNVAHARLLGFDSPEAAVGKTDWERFDGDLADKYRRDEQRVLTQGEVYNGEETLVDLDSGDKRWFQTTKVPLRDDQGNVVGLAGINRDITERRKTEEALRQKTALFVALVNSSLDGILVVGKDGHKILQNQQMIALWKIPAGIATDTNNTTQLEHITAMVKHPEAFRRKVDFLYSHPHETSRDEIELKDGTVLDRYTAPIRGEDGTYYGRIWTFRDITGRKRMESEMDKTHKELLQASRRAGMAEVATSVLHNVGNVLNSVNVSASMVAERIKNSGTSGLGKALDLLHQHKHDLARFLSEDSRGKQLLGYFEMLVEHVDTEKAEMLGEINALVRNLEHIKEIVVMQQTYARVAGVLEVVSLTELAEDALRMHALAYERHDVRVVREFQEIPNLVIDRHKVIQILVNLLQNAKYACDAQDATNRKVTVRIGRASSDLVRLEVADNGIGIPHENLTRIFSHGFTTRKNGHGFGLHSGALAAKEMGGSLTAFSAGPGKGATFTLELPFRQNSYPVEAIAPIESKASKPEPEQGSTSAA